MSELLTDDTIQKIIYWASLPQGDNVKGSYDHGYDAARNYIFDCIRADTQFFKTNQVCALVEGKKNEQ